MTAPERARVRDLPPFCSVLLCINNEVLKTKLRNVQFVVYRRQQRASTFVQSQRKNMETTAIVKQLAAAITDDDIQKGLYGAAVLGSVKACRLLWAKLSGRGARMYFTAKTTSCVMAGLCTAHQSELVI
jgi:hypothetical protein